MNRSIYIKGASLSVLGSIFWAVSGTCGQYLFETKSFDSGWLVAVRLLAAGFFMILLATKTQGKKTFEMWKKPKDRVEIILYGIFGMMGVQYTYFTAIFYSNAATATVLQYLGPAMIMVFMIVRTRSIPTKAEQISIICALVGVFLLVTHGNINAITISNAALFWGVLSAVGLAFYSIFPRRMLAEWGTLLTNGWGMFVGGIIISFLFRPWDYGAGIWDIATFFALFGVIFLGTIMSFFCYLEGVRLIGSTRASLYACVEPLAAAVIGIAWLRIEFGLLDWIGSAFIIATVFILSIKPKNSLQMD